MLSTYLHAAKNLVQTKQARPGVAVHVRLGGDDNDGGDKDKDKQGGSGASKTGVASSYAVWAVTGGWVIRLVSARVRSLFGARVDFLCIAGVVSTYVLLHRRRIFRWYSAPCVLMEMGADSVYRFYLRVTCCLLSAIWLCWRAVFLAAGRNACGVVRVACSEMAQTEVPVSAIQRVQVGRDGIRG